jgi:hypothetical protein
MLLSVEVLAANFEKICCCYLLLKRLTEQLELALSDVPCKKEPKGEKTPKLAKWLLPPGSMWLLDTMNKLQFEDLKKEDVFWCSKIIL